MPTVLAVEEKEQKTHKYLAWDGADVAMEGLTIQLRSTGRGKTAVGWEWCHFICHLSVSLWTTYSWGIHPCLVHLGAIARVPTKHALERTRPPAARTHDARTHAPTMPHLQSSQRWSQNRTKKVTPAFLWSLVETRALLWMFVSTRFSLTFFS